MNQEYILSSDVEAMGWAAIRTQRNKKLDRTDWTQLPDTALTEKQCADMREYRQALRDIPQAFDTPENVTWPECPL